MKAIVVTQTRLQSLWNSLSKIVPAAATWSVTIAIAALLVGGDPSPGTRLGAMFVFVLAAGGPIALSIWLIVFNRGKHEVKEAELRLDESGLTVSRFGEVEVIQWSDYRGYKITGVLRRHIRLEAKSGQAIVIDYHMFSGEQRDLVLAELDHCQRNARSLTGA